MRELPELKTTKNTKARKVFGPAELGECLDKGERLPFPRSACPHEGGGEELARGPLFWIPDLNFDQTVFGVKAVYDY